VTQSFDFQPYKVKVLYNVTVGVGMIDSGSGGSFGGFSATECPICLNVFNECRVPLATPCGHTLCRPCAFSVSNTSTPFDCPLCRERIENLEQLKVNVALRDLIEQVKAVSLRRAKSRSCGSPTLPSVDIAEVALEELIDTGAFGEVHRGRWRNNTVAVKVIRVGDVTQQAIESFFREIEVMNCLRHPNVVMMLAACTGAPRLGIVMEYVGGGSLYRLLHVHQRKLTEQQVKDVASDVTHGIQYLHSINIMHRDLKSKNVLLTDTKPATAKLCDFGLSRIRIETATMTGNIGTAQWIAPEILNESRYTFKADVYSFGIVLLEMVSNQVPFHGMHPLAVVMAVGTKKKKPSIPQNIHQCLTDLIHGCLEWDPRNRASIATVINALDTFNAADSEVLDLSEKVGHLHHQPSFESLMRTTTPCNQLKLDQMDVQKPDGDSAFSWTPVKNTLSHSPHIAETQMDIDFALAMQLQDEEQKVFTAGDSDLALQLHRIEGAKAEQGIARVDLDGGERFPYHPTGVFLGELKDVVKNKEAKLPVQTLDDPSPSSMNGTSKRIRTKALDPPGCTTDAPVLSSLVRSPSKSKSEPTHSSDDSRGERPKPDLTEVQLFDRNELRQVLTQEKNTLPTWEAAALEQLLDHTTAYPTLHKGHHRHISEPSTLPSQISSSDSAYESSEASTKLEQMNTNAAEEGIIVVPSCPLGSSFKKVFNSLKSVPATLKDSVPRQWREKLETAFKERKGSNITE
jgi:serine/threonine protein kinase